MAESRGQVALRLRQAVRMGGPVGTQGLLQPLAEDAERAGMEVAGVVEKVADGTGKGVSVGTTTPFSSLVEEESGVDALFGELDGVADPS